MSRKPQNPATVLAQAGGAIDMASGGVVPPIQPATTFVRAPNNEPVNAENTYARDHSDNVRMAEKVLTDLEGAADALLFPSGMAAVAALFRTVPNGGTVIVQSGIYWGTAKWISEFCARRDITCFEVDASDGDALEAVCAATKAQIVWVETPSNPWLKTVDICQTNYQEVKNTGWIGAR